MRHLAILRSQDSVPGKGTKSGKNRAKWCIAMAEGSQFSSAPSDNFSLCVCWGRGEVATESSQRGTGQVWQYRDKLDHEIRRHRFF